MDPFYWSISLIGVGLLVIFLELFVPSAGLLGIVAGTCLLSGVIVGFLHSAQTGIFELLALLLILPIMFAAMIKIWPHTPLGKRILIGPMNEDDVVPQGDYYDEIKTLVDQLGVVRSPMLPSGIVMINGKKYDAVSEGMPLDPGDTIKVIAVRGNRIVVAAYDGVVQADDMPATDADILSTPLEELGLDLQDGDLS